MAEAIIPLAVSAALAGASFALNKPKGSHVARDYTPTNLSQQGSYVPLLIGRRRLPAVFGWAGARGIYHDRSSHAKGIGGASAPPPQPVYYEAGWQQICIGPATALYAIYADGQKIWTGPRTPGGSPSGSALTIGPHDYGFFYWGEAAQPIHTDLGTVVGIASRWPHTCYHFWGQKSLGPSPRWQQIEFDIEVGANLDWMTSGEQTAYHTGGTDLTYGSFGSGPTAYGGVNPIFALAQLLFSPPPHGLGLSRDWFDFNPGSPTSCTFYDAAVQLAAEGATCSLLLADGEEVGAAIGTLMQDCGLILPRRPNGIYEFRLVRPVDDLSLIAVPETSLAQEVEVETLTPATTITGQMFSFPDRRRNYRESTIEITDDSHLVVGNSFFAGRRQLTQIATAIDGPWAAAIAERRSQEMLPSVSKLAAKVRLAGSPQIPGDVVQIEGISAALRLLEVRNDPRSAAVEWTLAIDRYGAPTSTFARTVPAIVDADVRSPDVNLAEDFLEVPAWLSAPYVQAVAPLRIRANKQVLAQEIYLSLDGTSYTDVGQDGAIMSGGALTSAMDATGWVLAQGPTLDTLGEDLADVAQDLSSDGASWRLGRQLVVIDDEIFFAQKVTALGGLSYRLDGLIRARYDTARASHSIGAKVFIFSVDALVPITDRALAPGAVLRIKQQPLSGVAAADLTGVSATTRTLVGKGLVPMRPCALRVTAPVLGAAAWLAGGDLTLAWSYRSIEKPRTGAGMAPAGMAVASSTRRGTFEVRLLTTGDVLKQTISGLTSPTYTLANADLVTWFGGEPSAIHVEVRNVDGGLRSPAITLTVTKV